MGENREKYTKITLRCTRVELRDWDDALKLLPGAPTRSGYIRKYLRRLVLLKKRKEKNYIPAH